MRSAMMLKVFVGSMIVMAFAGSFSAAAEQSADVWASIVKYEFGQSRTNLYAIEEEIRASAPKTYGQYEDKLLVLLNASGATYEAKDFACRMLRVVGSEKCVPVLVELLADEKMSHMARYAIQGFPFSSVDEAFRNALAKAKSGQKIGIISSIAARADRKAVPVLQPLVTDQDVAVAGAAISALGRIGTADALKVLTETKVADSLKVVQMESRLMCADVLLGKGDEKKAAAIYKELLADSNPKGIRAAAITGYARAMEYDALPSVMAMLKSRDGSSQRAAGKALMEIKGRKTANAVLAEINNLSADAQVIAINVLVANGTRAAAPEVAKLAGCGDVIVKIAAIQALAALGDASNVELLAGLVKEGGDVAKAAVESLSRLKGKGVSEAIMKSLAGVDSGSRVTLIGSLAERQNHEIVPDLMKYADDPDELVQAETMKTLGSLVNEKEIPVLIGMMLKAKPGRVQTAAEQAVQVACMKINGEGKKIEPLVAAMKDSKVEERAVILHCLGRLGGEKALEIVRGNLKDKDENVQESAIRALADWTDEGALGDLRELSKTAPKDNLKIVAFRGLIRIITLPASVKANPGKAAKALSEAMSVAARPDEKKLVLGALSGIPDFAALDVARKYIQDETLRMEAELACVRVAQRLRPGKPRDKAMEIVKTIAETTKTESVRKQAEAALKK